MGSALLGRWLASGLPESAVKIIDPAPKALPGHADLKVVSRPPSDPAPQILVLAIKPQLLSDVALMLRPVLGTSTLTLSILAGTRAATIADQLGTNRIVRAMPNTPAGIGQGVTALYAYGATREDIAVADALMQTAGVTHWVDESLFDIITAISGSGPAYVYRFIEALAAAGIARGLPASLVEDLAHRTVIGAVRLLEAVERSPAELREQVTSPNGTTQAGLNILDGDGALTRLLDATVEAAALRSRALGKD